MCMYIHVHSFILFLITGFLFTLSFCHRAAALKTLFPTDSGGDSSTKQSAMDVDVNKKFSTSTHYRSCLECSQPNPRSAKKCQKCQKPLQGKACPQCGRPNHSWVPSCYKCGTTLPSYLGKTGKRNTGKA